jgi:putative membrane protein
LRSSGHGTKRVEKLHEGSGLDEARGHGSCGVGGFTQGVAMMKCQNRWVWLVAMFVAGICVGMPRVMADDKSDQSGQITPQDQEFVNQAAVINMAEVELGKMAQSKASNQDVKTFAKRMVDDHQKANKELQQIVQQQKGQMPKELDQQHKDMKDKLSKLSGSEFDKQYMEAMAMGHQKAVSLFETESKSETPIGKWAGTTLATLHEHHQEATRIAKEVGGNAQGAEQK